MKLKETASMKNRTLLMIMAVLALAVPSMADTVYNQALVNNQSSALTANYYIDTSTTPNQSGIARMSAQVVASSLTTAGVSTFTDGRASTGIVTLASNSDLVITTATNNITLAATATLLAAPATNQITILSTSGISAATLTYFNGTSSNTLVGGVDWFVTNTTSGTAASIASALSLYSGLQISRTNAVIYASATVNGSAGNSFRFASSSPTVISTAAINFSGGHGAPLTNAYLTINGQILRQGQAWVVQDTSSGTATSIATVLNLIPGIAANAAGSVVYTTATTGGAIGNSYTLVSSSPGYMTVATANYAGGIDNASLTINGVALTQGHDWIRTSTSSGTTKAIADAINANSTLSPLITATWSSGSTFTIAADQVGTSTNYTTVASTVAIVPGHATLTGGTNSAYTINSPNLVLTANGYTTGTAVLLSTGGATPPIPLVNQTTYYIISIDANDVELATTSARAAAGQYLTFTSSTTTGPHTFTLTPLGLTGTPGIQWQVSNDSNCATGTYTNLATTSAGVTISSFSFASPYNATSAVWDFGAVDYRCIQAAVTGPTAGTWNVKVTVTGKNNP